MKFTCGILMACAIFFVLTGESRFSETISIQLYLVTPWSQGFEFLMASGTQFTIYVAARKKV